MSEPSNRIANYSTGLVSVPNETWNYVVEEFNRKFHRSLLFLKLAFDDGRVTLEAAVASEGAREYLLNLVGRHPDARIIVDLVVVKAPFRSAGHDPMDEAVDDWTREFESSHASDNVALERYPHISLKGPLSVGSEVVIAIYLEEEVDEFTEGGPTVFPNVDPNWTTLPVDVLVNSGQLIFDEGSEVAQVKVRRGQKSLPALIAAQVSERALETGSIELNVQFMFERKRCGVAKRTFPLEALEKADGQPMPSGQGASKANVRDLANRPNFSTPAILDRTQQASDFVVTIHRHGSGASGMYGWQTYSHHASIGRHQTTGEINLTSSAREFAQDLLRVCQTLNPGDHKRTLRSIGQTIWKRTPDSFKKHYLSLVEKIGPDFPIQFFSDEPFVPWEMMWPDDESQGADHMFVKHPVARWPSSTSCRAAQAFPEGMIASFVPTYGNRALPCAQQEWGWLRDNLGAVAQEPTREAFLSFLENPPQDRVQLIHFAGHGSSARPSPSIELSEGLRVAVNEVDQGGVRLGNRDHSFFVLNACEIAAETLELGMASGWATALADNGFGGVLAPIWVVKDEHASQLVTSTLNLFLRDGETVAEALRRSRSLAMESSPTPYAYIFYGDVMARA